MRIRTLMFSAALAAALVAIGAAPLLAQATPKAPAPVLITSCGQSPGANMVKVSLQRAGVEYSYKEDASAKDLAGKKFRSVIIVTGASLKGMGAAGVSMDDELKRTAALIAEARRQGVVVVGAHVEGMARRAQGAAPGDNSDELSIDAVCPNAQFMIVRKDGDEDKRFTTISQAKKIPLVLFEKNLDLPKLAEAIFK
jgi:hypothetical protein